MQTIKLKDKEYPIRFDFNTLRAFGKLTGINKLSELQNLGDQITLDQTLTLIFCGIKEGCRRENIAFDFTIEQVADYLADESGLIGETMSMFQESRAPVEDEKKSDAVTNP